MIIQDRYLKTRTTGSDKPFKRHGPLSAFVITALMIAALLLYSASPLLGADQPPVSTFLYPVNGSTGFDPSKPIQWTAPAGAEGYYLWVGTSPGGKDIYQSGATSATSRTVAGLPQNKILYARIWTKFNGQWNNFSDVSFTSIAKATFRTPLNGGVLDGAASFSWNPAPNAQGYYLWIGSAPGGKDLYQSGETGATSLTVTALPPNIPLYARLYTKINGSWNYFSDISCTSIAKATFIKPANGGSIDGPATFTWSAVPNTQEYYLWIGSAPGAKDIYTSGVISTTSRTVSGLPANRPLHARIWTRINGQWNYFNDVSFTSIARAAFVTPVNGGVLDGPATFSWNAVPNAQGYYLWIGSAPGGKDLYQSGETSATSFTSSTLPKNVALYARLYTKINGGWNYFSDISFTSIAKATLIKPVNGGVLDGSTTFTWTAVPNAQAYSLWIGGSPGTNDLYAGSETSGLSSSVSGLPVNQTIYARIRTKISGVWYSSDISFTNIAKARFIYPLDGSMGIDRSRPFAWTAAPNAQSYYLWVGTTPGGKEIFQAGMLQRTQFFVPRVQSDRMLYARIWTLVEDKWYFSDAAVRPAVTFTYPQPGATAVDFSQPFQWTSSNGAQAFRLLVWTGLHGEGLYDSGEIASASLAVPNLPTDRPVYARLFVKLDGEWFFNDATFNPAANFVYPLEGAVDVDTTRPFEWSGVNNAISYRLKVGSILGGNEHYDSGELTGINGMESIRRFVPLLPMGSPLFAQLTIRFPDTIYTKDITFKVLGNQSRFQDKVDTALWATKQVRDMANSTNTPYLGTELESLIRWRGHAAASCADYQGTLLNLFSTVNVGSTRQLNIDFDEIETHALVEFFHEEQQSWMLLDPTFYLSARRNSDGQWATYEDVHNATLQQAWNDITFSQIDPKAQPLASGYYLDYPLLFLNRISPPLPDTRYSPLPYLQEVPFPIQGTGDFYILRNSGATPDNNQAVLDIDGQSTTLEFIGPDQLSKVFWAHTVSLPDGSPLSLNAFISRRYVFQ